MRYDDPRIVWCVASLSVWFVACARDSVSLGDEGLAEQVLTPSARCASDGFIDADVRVTNQAELDALAGCEEVSGELVIEVFPGTDLRPLASLRAVGGQLVIGARSSTLDNDSLLALVDAGWLESFEGMEALERVGALALVNFMASDLSPFSGLRYVNAANPDTGARAGSLNVEYAKNLTDLRGLEHVTGIESITLVGTPALESLDGITLGSRFDSIMLQKAPRLSNIDALAPLMRGTSLAVLETAVADLHSLSALRQLDFFQIEANPLLVDASSIPSPTAQAFTVARNPQLRGVLEVRAPFTMTDIAIADNDQLERITFDDRESHTPGLTSGSITIARNLSLRSVTSPNGCDALVQVDVSDNPSLESLDLGRLVRLDELHIRENPGLYALSHATFERIYVVDVINNPLLAVDSLAGIPAFERTLEGNAN